MNNKTYRRIQNSITFGTPGVVFILGIIALIREELGWSIFMFLLSIIALLIYRLQDKRDKKMHDDALVSGDEQ